MLPERFSVLAAPFELRFFLMLSFAHNPRFRMAADKIPIIEIHMSARLTVSRFEEL